MKIRTVIILVAVVVIAMIGEWKFVETRTFNHYRREVGTFETPMPLYNITEFTNFPSFEAKVFDMDIGNYLEKHSGKTNFYFMIFLEKTNGDQFTVLDTSTSQEMFQVVNSLEKDRSYTFPDALVNGSQGNIHHWTHLTNSP